MTAAGVALSLLMVGGMLLLIMVNGLGQFWPAALTEHVLTTGELVLGQVVGKEVIPSTVTPDRPEGQLRFRLRVGNRDVLGSDYRWVNADDIASTTQPKEAAFIERREWGPAYGRITAVVEGEVERPVASWQEITALVGEANELREKIEHLERDEIGAINHRIEAARLARQALLADGTVSPEEAAEDRLITERLSDPAARRRRLVSLIARLARSNWTPSRFAIIARTVCQQTQVGAILVHDPQRRFAALMRAEDIGT